MRDSDGATLSYSFNKALFDHAFFFFISGGILTRGLLLYLFFIVLVTLIAALSACATDGVSSFLTGPGGGCWRNVYTAGWADMTLSSLAAFLLGLLVNQVLTRWWTTRMMVQDAINQTVHVFFLLTVCSESTRWRSAAELAQRSRTLDNVKRRLKLAFRILLISARTDYSVDRIKVTDNSVDRIKVSCPSSARPLRSPTPNLNHPRKIGAHRGEDQEPRAARSFSVPGGPYSG